MIHSLEQDLLKIKHVTEDLNFFIRKIRLVQYQRRNKILDIDFSEMKAEITEFFQQIEEKLAFFNENKDLLVKAKMNKKFNSWEDSFIYIIKVFRKSSVF